MSDILWPIIITSVVVLSISIACIAQHCWSRRTSHGACPFCHCKLDLPDVCLECGASRVKIGG